jgi:hypothetical protein
MKPIGSSSIIYGELGDDRVIDEKLRKRFADFTELLDSVIVGCDQTVLSLRGDNNPLANELAPQFEEHYQDAIASSAAAFALLDRPDPLPDQALAYMESAWDSMLEIKKITEYHRARM